MATSNIYSDYEPTAADIEAYNACQEKRDLDELKSTISAFLASQNVAHVIDLHTFDSGKWLEIFLYNRKWSDCREVACSIVREIGCEVRGSAKSYRYTYSQFSYSNTPNGTVATLHARIRG